MGQHVGRYQSLLGFGQGVIGRLSRCDSSRIIQSQRIDGRQGVNLRNHRVGGCLISGCAVQLLQRFFAGCQMGQHVGRYQSLLGFRQGVKSFPGRCDSSRIIQSQRIDGRQGVNLRNHRVGGCLILQRGNAGFRSFQNSQVADRSLLGFRQGVKSFPGRCNSSRIVQSQIFRCRQRIDHFHDLPLLGAFFLGVVVRVVPDDDVAILQELFRDTQIRIRTVQGVHPPGICTVAELCQRIAIIGDGRYVIAGFILPGHVVISQSLFKYIFHRGVHVHRVGSLFNPQLQILIGPGMRAGLLRGIAMDGIAVQGEINGDIRGDRSLHHADLELDGNSVVGSNQGQQLALRGVEPFHADVLGRDGAGGAVRPGSGEYRTGEVQFFPNIIRVLVIPGDRQGGDDGLVVQDRELFSLGPVLHAGLRVVEQLQDSAVCHFFNSTFFAQLFFIRTHGIVGTVVIGLADAGVLPIAGTLILGVYKFLDVVQAVRRGIIVENTVVTHTEVVGAGVDMLYRTNGSGTAVRVVIVVVLNDIVSVQRGVIAHQAANVILTIQRAVEHVVADIANAILPALVNPLVGAQKAADILLTGDVSIDIDILDADTHGVGCGIGIITGADDAADIAARGDNRTGERAVGKFARSHGVRLAADQTANIAHAIDGRSTAAVFDRADQTARKGADVAAALIIADDDAGFRLTVVDIDGVIGGSGALHQAGTQGGGAGHQRHVIDFGNPCAGGLIDPRAVDQRAALNLLAVDLQVFDHRAFCMVNQRLTALGKVELIAATVQRAAEYQPAGAVGAHGLPGIRQRDIVGHSEVDAGEVDPLLHILLDGHKVLAGLQQVGVFLRAAARKAEVLGSISQLHEVRYRRGGLAGIILGHRGDHKEYIVLALGQPGIRREGEVMGVAAGHAPYFLAGDGNGALRGRRGVIIALQRIGFTADLRNCIIPRVAVVSPDGVFIVVHLHIHGVKRGAGHIFRPINTGAVLCPSDPRLDADYRRIHIGQFRSDLCRITDRVGRSAVNGQRDLADIILGVLADFRIRRRHISIRGGARNRIFGIRILQIGGKIVAIPLVAEGALLGLLRLHAQGDSGILGNAALRRGLRFDHRRVKVGSHVLCQVQRHRMLGFRSVRLFRHQPQGDISGAAVVAISRQVDLLLAGIGLLAVSHVELNPGVKPGGQRYRVIGGLAVDVLTAL